MGLAHRSFQFLEAYPEPEDVDDLGSGQEVDINGSSASQNLGVFEPGHSIVTPYRILRTE